ncbi:MAG: AAA family ATPase [Oscillospiraceae bacterium]|jgi:cytidylate kinase|nr:AAA family ATPase [Oscillospiraceae bacterium]
MPIKISVTGDLGSGKSTVCRKLQAMYNLEMFSTGIIQRKLASEMKMSIFDLNKYMETHPEIDRLIDGELIALSDSNTDIVIDSRMAWHFVRNTYKVFLTVDETVAAKRVMYDKRGSSEIYSDVQDAKRQLKARKASENFRYKDKYHVDCYDLRNFDLIIDTTSVSSDYTANMIMSQYNAEDGAADKQFQLWLSQFCLYPTQTMKTMSDDIFEKYCDMILRNESLPPIDVLFSNGFFYIVNGHHSAAAYCKTKKPLIPCSLFAGSDDSMSGGSIDDQHAKNELDITKIYDWEADNGFRYFSYPSEQPFIPH